MEVDPRVSQYQLEMSSNFFTCMDLDQDLDLEKTLPGLDFHWLRATP